MYYKSYEELVGYIKIGEIICIINTYPGDDIYLTIKTYKTSRLIDSAMLCYGTSGAGGCEVDSNKEEVKLIAPNQFLNTRILKTTDCDNNGNKVKGTSKIEKGQRTITIKTNGSISVNETAQ